MLFAIITHWIAFGLGFVAGALVFSSKTKLEESELRELDKKLDELERRRRSDEEDLNKR